MPASFILEVSPSARSACKKCKEKIPKGALRIGSISEKSDSDMVFKSYYHTACFSIPRTQEIQDASEWCDAVLVDETEDHIMGKKKERSKVIADIASDTKAIKKSGESDAAGSSNKMEKFKAIAEKEKESKKKKKVEEDDDDKPKSKKVKLTKDEEAEYEIYSMHHAMTNDALQDILRWNLQIVSGSKPILLARVVDGQMRGRLTRCPLCNGGKVGIRDEDCTYASCTGYFDEDKGGRVSCSFKAPVEKCPRLQPWFTEKPTDEESNEIKQIDENAKLGKSTTSQSSTQATEKLTAKVKALDWKTTTKEDIKATTAAIISILTEGEGTKVNLPEGRETMAVGKIVAGNQSKSAEEILAMIVEQFGFAADSKDEDAKRAELLKSTCTVAANAPILMIILELKRVYDKEGNSQAANSYNKVADAIKNLDYEITAKNAMGMSKGKAKVAGIGKGSAEKIKEFLDTGTIAKLEEKRAANAV